MKKLMLLITLSAVCYAGALSDKRKRLNEYNNSITEKFLTSLTKEDRSFVLSIKRKMNSGVGLHLLMNEKSAHDEVVLLVEGHPVNPGEEDLGEWYKTSMTLKKKGYKTYYHSLNKKWTIKTNAKKFNESIAKVLADNPGKLIKVFAFSAGGTVAIRAKSMKYKDHERIELHTMAAPIFGFGAPAFFKIFAWSLPMDMGVGVIKRVNYQGVKNCFHHVTNNCELDVNACAYRKIYSQFGSMDSYQEGMPCGINSTEFYPDETHETIINSVIDKYIR